MTSWKELEKILINTCLEPNPDWTPVYDFVRKELKRERRKALKDIKDWLDAETITIKADFNGYLEDYLKEKER